MTLQPRIEELKKLHQKATKAPWSHGTCEDRPGVTFYLIGGEGELFARIPDFPLRREKYEANARLIVALRNAFPAIVEALEQRWIPVSERLPEMYKDAPGLWIRVLAAAVTESGKIVADAADFKIVDGDPRWLWMETNNDNEQIEALGVYAWQPLPAPPTTKASAT